MADSPQTPPASVSRRRVLSWAGGAGAAGAALGALGDHLAHGSTTPTRQSSVGEPRVGPRLEPAASRVRSADAPQGLLDRVPAFGQVLTLDLAPGVRRSATASRRATVDLLRRLGDLASRAAAGTDLGPVATASLGLLPANLQITPGIGHTLLEACGLASAAPAAFGELPAFAGDRLDPRQVGGDLTVQIGAEDPIALAGAVQAVRAAAAGPWTSRWSWRGFRATAAASVSPDGTGRNLMGHLDGTDNPALGSPLWRSTVLVTDASSWMHAGSYLVARRIRIDLDGWFGNSVADRDAVIGRHTSNGAAFGSDLEHDPVDLDLRSSSGGLLISPHAHIRLANARNTAGARIYRRSWNFDDGLDPDGARDSGLVFLAWQADVERGFVPIQRSLTSGHDALNQFTTHVGSAVFAAPARSAVESYAGQRLLEG
ncbi:MAG TPA: Dyp-type peroxidase [Marmoricola sp.]|jgi:dye decolorizing peroxidase|nr:Dyp-type peroxidase [Marmoricola sp.]